MCLAFSWFLSVLEKHQNVRFGKIVGILGVIGALVLVSMALTGPYYPLESNTNYIPEGIVMSDSAIETNPDVLEAKLKNIKLLSKAKDFIRTLGHPPDNEHLRMFEDVNGKRWVTKSEWKELKGN